MSINILKTFIHFKWVNYIVYKLYLDKAIFYKGKTLRSRIGGWGWGSWRAHGISGRAGLPGCEPETSRALGRYVRVKPPLLPSLGTRRPSLHLQHTWILNIAPESAAIIVCVNDVQMQLAMSECILSPPLVLCLTNFQFKD